MKHIYTSIDIGTDTTKVVVTELYKGKLNLLAASSIKSTGIKKGLITDVEEASKTLKKAVSEVEDMLGISIKKVLVNIPSYFADFVKVEGTIRINESVVGGNDISKVIGTAIKNSNFSKEVVTVTPIDFFVDEQSGISDPKGLMGDVLGVRAVVSLVPKKNIYSVVSLVDSIGLEVIDISLGGIGDVNAFKSKEIDSSLGAVINVGYETTSVSIYNKGIIIKNSIIGMGGKNIDNDLSYMYKIDLIDACSVKEKFALAHRSIANKVEFYDIGNVKINQLEATDVVMSRIEEILGLAKKEIHALANRKMEYIIVTGGVSNMDGFEIIAQDVFGKDVKIGNVNLVGIRNNKYSSAVGNIVYYINQLKLLGNDSTMVDDDFSEEKFNINEDSMLGKVFGYFFGDTNEEEL